MHRYHPTAVLRHYAFTDTPDQVAAADRYTSMCDARTAICAANGVDFNDIDPASGYNHSRRSFEASRRSWIESIEQGGYDPFYDEAPLKEAFGRWEAARPEFTAGSDWGDWLAAGIAAHRTYWAGVGRPCNRDDCEFHEPTPVVEMPPAQLVIDAA